MKNQLQRDLLSMGKIKFHYFNFISLEVMLRNVEKKITKMAFNPIMLEKDHQVFKIVLSLLWILLVIIITIWGGGEDFAILKKN